MDPTRLLSLARQARQTGLLGVLGREGCDDGLASLGGLLVFGLEAADFLHGQVTNEVKALAPGEGNYSARVARTGDLLRLFSLHRLPAEAPRAPGLLLILERSLIPGLREDLDRFLFSDETRMEDVSEHFEWLALQGPAAPAAAESALGTLGGRPWHELPENAVRVLNGAGLPPGALALCRSLTGDTGYLFLLPREARAAAEKLKETARSQGLATPEGADLRGVLEILRIEAGVVRMGADVEAGKRVLPETGLEQEVVSYSKGCYVGQEVIARIRTYGSASLALRGLVLDGVKESEAPAALENLPDAGADLLLEDGKKAGTIVSRTFSPVLEAPVAFAYLDRERRTPGQRLAFRGKQRAFTARVALLPFYRAADRKARARFLHERAIRGFAERRDDEAVTLLEESLRLDPSFADAYEALGVILGRSERYHEAIDIFKRLEEVAPDEPMVHTNLSLFYMRLGDKQTAEEEKAKATVKRFGTIASVQDAEKRAAEDAAGRRADAHRKKAMFREVLEIDAEDPVALFGLGNAHATLGELEEAARAYERACAVQKDNSALYLARGKALELLHREAEAVAVYREGIRVASRKGDLMPLKEMEHRALLLETSAGKK